MGDSTIDRLVSRSRQSGPRGFPDFCSHEAALCSPAFSWNRRMKWFVRRCQSAMQTSFMLMAVGLALNCTGCALFPAMKSTLNGDTTNGSSLQSIDTKTQAEACRRTALQLAAHEKDDHAVAQFERARELHPKIKGVAHPLAVLYDRQGKIDAADRAYRHALKESGKDADVLNDYGYFLYSRGDLARSEEMLQLSLRQKNDHPKAQVNLALVMAAQGRMDQSFAMFEKAVGPAAAHHNIGMLQLRAGSHDEGLEHLRQAAERDPSLPSATIVASLQQDRAMQPIIALAERTANSQPQTELAQ